MIALVKLDRDRHCLDRLEAGGGAYLCRRPRDHSGEHDYLPTDIVILAERRDRSKLIITPPANI
jgi:hypothetical protein